MTSRAKPGEGFVFQKDGEDYLKLCIDFTLYFVGPLSDHAAGIEHFYDLAIKLIKKDLVQYETGTMSKPKPIKADAFDLLPLWISNTKAKQDMMQLRLDNSTTPDSAADRAFQFIYFKFDEAGAVRLVLPVSFAEKSVKPLVDLARSLPLKLSFASGHGGYSLNWNKIGDLAHEAKKDVYAISQRYPGVDIPDLDGDMEVIAQGIKGVNWLTFLGGAYLDRLGGLERLTKTLKGDIECAPLGNGAVVQAGPRPETGDVNRRQTLPLYQEVGKTVAKLRFKEHMAFVPSPRDADQATAKWLARFDR